MENHDGMPAAPGFDIPLYVNRPIVSDEDVERAIQQEMGS